MVAFGVSSRKYTPHYAYAVLSVTYLSSVRRFWQSDILGCGFGVRRLAGTEEGWVDGERVERVGRERGRREESEAGGTRSEGFKG